MKSQSEISTNTILKYVGLITERAAACECRGQLVLASYGQDPVSGENLPPRVLHFNPGEAELNLELSHDTHRNIYIPLCSFRRLKPGGKGAIADIEMVFGLCADFDDENASLYKERLPISPSMVLETSENRFQAFYFFDKGMTAPDAAPLAAGLYNFSGCDHGSKDLSHVWRVPGTLNWPNAKKVKEGRDTIPQLVRICEPFTGRLINPDDLRIALKGHMPEEGKKTRKRSASSEPVDPVDPNVEPSVELVNELCKTYPQFKLTWEHNRTDHPGWSLSEYDFSIVRQLLDAEIPVDEIEKIVLAFRRRHGDAADIKKALRPDYVNGMVEKILQDSGSSKFELQYPLSDLGNAQRIASEYRGQIHFIERPGRNNSEWVTWGGKNWEISPDVIITRFTTKLSKLLRDEAKKISNADLKEKVVKWAHQSEMNSRQNGCKSLLRCELGISIDEDKFDRHRYLLNVKNGTLDLKTGKLKNHDRSDYITQLAPVVYDPTADCPEWKRFLDRFCQRPYHKESSELHDYLQRIVGYTLTGDTLEQCIFFLLGKGSNGKSVFLEAIRAILGRDFTASPRFDEFYYSEYSKTEYVIDKMHKKRFVSAIEGEAGKSLSESLIKQLTGCDTVSGRSRYEKDDREFMPTAKIFLASNSKPKVKGTDNGFWRRIRLIRIIETIPELEQDKGIQKKFQKELPGILNWAIMGCLEWQKQGLNTPQFIKEDTDTYRKDMDSIANFIDDFCEIDENERVEKSILLNAYMDWCKQTKSEPVGRTTFYKSIADRGFNEVKNEKRFFQGLYLN